MNREEFIDEVKALSITLDDDKLTKLEEYYQILTTENQKYNLTRIISKEDIYLKHFYDSLTITKIITIDNQKICDIGSGAGFPGLVLAICFPNAKLTLIESNGKKCKFLNIVKDKLSLSNVEIKNVRAEEYAKDVREEYDLVTARAVAPLKHLLEYGIPLVKTKGYFIAMKSNVTEEMQNIENYYHKLDITIEDKIEFNLPYEHSLRTLLKYQKQTQTSNKYPRKYADIIKKEI